ncbi:MAG: toll/interleukin-1 receptor domain-containing protein [Nitrososphaeraceae archaeon]
MKIFVSYSREDAGNFAKHIHRFMKNKSHDVFIDVNSIKIGEPWANSIEKNISDCDIFVVIVTPDSLLSSNVEREVLQAQRENKIIVPCINENIEYRKIKWGLNEIQGIEFEDEYDLVIKLHSHLDIREEKELCNSKIVEEESSQLYLDKAKDFEDIGQYDRALRQYEKSIEKEPYNFQAIYSKALFLERIEKLEEALETIEQAIDIEPIKTDVWYHKASILEKMERYEEAKKALDIDLKLDSNDVKKWTSKAKLLEKIGKFDEAIQCYDRVLMLNPNNDNIAKKNKILEKLSIIERYPYARFPDKVNIDDIIPLEIVIKSVKALTFYKNTTSIELKVDNKNQKEIPVQVIVECDDEGFEIEGKYYATINVPVNTEDSKPVIFNIKSKKEGNIH